MTALFLDRDGVINRNRDDYVKSWDEFEFLPGALDALRKLAEMQYRVVVVTNQSSINRGIVSRQVVEAMNSRMIDEVAAQGGKIEAVYYCPHRPDENCRCRKPRPGLLYEARDHLNVDLSSAFLVGDHMTDIETARAAGCAASILVLSGRHQAEAEIARGSEPLDFYIAKDLLHAVDLLRTVGPGLQDGPSARERECDEV